MPKQLYTNYSQTLHKLYTNFT